MSGAVSDMRGFTVFLGKEAKEIVRTWRMWVLPLIMVSFGVLSPVIAMLTPQLVDSLAGSQTGMSIEIPDPTTVDAYLQFSKNSAQITLFAIIISMAGMVSAERRSGTAVLVLVKPLSRSAFVTAKVVSNWALVIVSTLLGWLAALATTALLFDVEGLGQFAGATALWLVLALTFVSVMALMSVAINSQAGAAGAGLGVYLVVAILSGWGPARDNTLAGLYTAGDRLVMGDDPTLLWPVATAVGLSLLCVALAVLHLPPPGAVAPAGTHDAPRWAGRRLRDRVPAPRADLVGQRECDVVEVDVVGLHSADRLPDLLEPGIAGACRELRIQARCALLSGEGLLDVASSTSRSSRQAAS